MYIVDPNAGQASRAAHRDNQEDNPIQAAGSQLVIALSAKWHTYPQRLHWIAEHGFALEYAPNPEALALFPQCIAPFLQAGLPLRYHGFFPGYEFAHADLDAARRGLDVHLAALEVMPGRGEPVITVHIGLRRQDPLDSGRAVDHLAHLVERGRQLGITVCLENLRQGPTSNPETVVEWAAASGAMITLDVGHAVSSQRVQEGELDPLDFVAAFAPRLAEVHIYEQETDRHYPPQDMSLLGPIVDRLIETPCRWWTIELDDYAEALATRALLLDYLESKRKGGGGDSQELTTWKTPQTLSADHSPRSAQTLDCGPARASIFIL
jgi:sugar phosphate isomerase/epimerase